MSTTSKWSFRSAGLRPSASKDVADVYPGSLAAVELVRGQEGALSLCHISADQTEEGTTCRSLEKIIEVARQSRPGPSPYPQLVPSSENFMAARLSCPFLISKSSDDQLRSLIPNGNRGWVVVGFSPEAKAAVFSQPIRPISNLETSSMYEDMNGRCLPPWNRLGLATAQEGELLAASLVIEPQGERSSRPLSLDVQSILESFADDILKGAIFTNGFDRNCKEILISWEYIGGRLVFRSLLAAEMEVKIGGSPSFATIRSGRRLLTREKLGNVFWGTPDLTATDNTFWDMDPIVNCLTRDVIRSIQPLTKMDGSGDLFCFAILYQSSAAELKEILNRPGAAGTRATLVLAQKPSMILKHLDELKGKTESGVKAINSLRKIRAAVFKTFSSLTNRGKTLGEVLGAKGVTEVLNLLSSVSSAVEAFRTNDERKGVELVLEIAQNFDAGVKDCVSQIWARDTLGQVLHVDVELEMMSMLEGKERSMTAWVLRLLRLRMDQEEGGDQIIFEELMTAYECLRRTAKEHYQRQIVVSNNRIEAKADMDEKFLQILESFILTGCEYQYCYRDVVHQLFNSEICDAESKYLIVTKIGSKLESSCELRRRYLSIESLGTLESELLRFSNNTSKIIIGELPKIEIADPVLSQLIPDGTLQVGWHFKRLLDDIDALIKSGSNAWRQLAKLSKCDQLSTHGRVNREILTKRHTWIVATMTRLLQSVRTLFSSEQALKKNDKVEQNILKLLKIDCKEIFQHKRNERPKSLFLETRKSLLAAATRASIINEEMSRSVLLLVCGSYFDHLEGLGEDLLKAARRQHGHWRLEQRDKEVLAEFETRLSESVDTLSSSLLSVTSSRNWLHCPDFETRCLFTMQRAYEINRTLDAASPGVVF